MKKLKFDFRLSHILFFFFGIMVTVVLLWILYKDPTRITAPALAALTAMCTFLLALWSAFKVNKWLNSKVNDSAYKQTEKIIAALAEMHLSLEFIRAQCFTLTDITVYSDKSDLWFKNLLNYIKELDEKGFQCFINSLSLINTLKLFNASVDVVIVMPLISKIQKYHAELRNELLDIDNTYHSKTHNLTVEAAQNYINKHKEISYLFKNLFNLRYDDIFMFNVKPTLPVEKVSE
ncbi:TPA: hypothetical protein ACHJX8_004360 [Yersinia enterocolitica]